MNPTDLQQSSPQPVKRRRYDEQFKRDAVALLEGGRGATQLARELGISQWNLRDWKLLHGSGSAGGKPAGSAPQAGIDAAGAVAVAVEMAGLRRELEAVTRQRDILKKPWPSLPRNPRTPRADGNPPPRPAGPQRA